MSQGPDLNTWHEGIMMLLMEDHCEGRNRAEVTRRKANNARKILTPPQTTKEQQTPHQLEQVLN